VHKIESFLKRKRNTKN